MVLEGAGQNQELVPLGHASSSDGKQAMKDIGLIGAFILGNMALNQARPYIGPLSSALLNGIQSNLVVVRDNTIYVSRSLINAVRSLRQRPRQFYLIRWLGSSLPASWFSTSQRIHVIGRVEDLHDKEAKEDVLPSAFTTSFRNLPNSPIGDLDIEGGDSAEGIFMAYVKSTEEDGSSDTESQLDEVDCDITSRDSELDPLWGSPTNNNTNISFSFVRDQEKCSTPKFGAHGNVNTNTFTIGEDSSVTQAATDAKLHAMEAELEAMKKMLALVLENQTKSSTIADQTTLPSTSLLSVPACAPPPPPMPMLTKAPPAPPPPPPPPPPPMLPSAATSSSSGIKLKVGSGGLSRCEVDLTKPKVNSIPSLTDILKALPNVRLKQIPRSPGGTPMKAKREPDMNDLADVINSAVRKRYTKVADSSSSDYDSYDKENKNDTDDSFNKSPAYFKPNVKLLKTNPTPCIRKTEVVDENKPMASFGQHLLKRRRSSNTSRNRLFTLTEQDQNIERN